MNKMFAVLKREYLQAVRKKAFIIMTLLFPFLMAALMIVPGLIMAKGIGKKRVAVIDGTGQLRDAFVRDEQTPAVDPAQEARKALSGRRTRDMETQINIEYADAAGKDVTLEAQRHLERMTRDKDAADYLEGVFVIPPAVVGDGDAQMTYYSRSATDFMTQERLARRANRALQRHRLTATGVDEATIERALQDVGVDAIQLSRTGETKKGGELNFIVAFVFGALLILPSFVYGQETMRGIIQEKSDRVVEVLVSSMSPTQLLTGKILGVAAVGLTQIMVWLAIIALVGAYGVATAAVAGVNLTQFIRPMVFVYFIVFFVLAYLTYVCIYAIAGAICNSEKEAQQFIMPLVLIMMLPWILMMPIVMNPEAPFAVALSLAPVFGPITMFVRAIVAEPPLWHILLTIGISILTIAAFFWATGKIFRVGILSYGKRPTVPELWRWLKVA